MKSTQNPSDTYWPASAIEKLRGLGINQVSSVINALAVLPIELCVTVKFFWHFQSVMPVRDGVLVSDHGESEYLATYCQLAEG
ncbi:hypothetical protein APHAL10511_004084 [Amanita phalloides]|nr:hypothetical protein APHAL10511_004084 [Amanita phalloides]